MAESYRQMFAVDLVRAEGAPSAAKTFSATITTRSPDRMGDIVDPAKLSLAAYRRNPVVLFQHDSSQPIGKAVRLKAEGDSVTADFVLASTDKGQEVATLIDEGILNAVSIGFRALEKPDWNDERRGLDFKKTELLEFSVVSIPANSDALIFQRAAPMPEASRPASPERSGALPRSIPKEGRMAGSMGEQIAEYTRARQDKQATIERLHTDAADENRALDETEQTRFDGLAEEIKGLDRSIANAKALEQLQFGSARQVSSPALLTRGAPIQIKRPAPGIGFARYSMALVHARRFGSNPVETAKAWRDSTPEVELALRAAMQPDFQRAPTLPAVTTNAPWAGALMPEANYLGSELIELLYPKTILGQLQPRNVPFRVKIPRVTTGASANWVGEGKAKPVSSASFDLVSLDFHKLAVLAVMSEELLRFGDPSVESTVRDILAVAIQQKIDTTFISSAPGVPGVSPPGIVNAATSITSTGGTLAQIEADLLAVMTAFANQNIPLSSVVVVMNPRSKMYLSVLRTANDTLAFPEIVANNTWRGMRIVDSNQVPIVGTAPALTSMIFIAESDILVARDPSIRVDSSREATIEMSSDPEADTGSQVNLFQTNMVAILLEQAITWVKARTNSVIVLASVPY